MSTKDFINFAVNIMDLANHSNDLAFHVLIDGKITRSIVKIQKNKFDGSYALLMSNLPYTQKLALCQILQKHYKIRCYYQEKKRWLRVK